MKRPYLLYLLAVVLPSAMVVGAGLSASGDAWIGMTHASEARAARMAIFALREDVRIALLPGVGETDTVSAPDVPRELIAQAMQGGSVVAIVTAGEGVDIVSAHPPDTGDSEGEVRTKRAPLPISVLQAGRASGYRAALYVDGVRRMGTDPFPGPEQLDRGLRTVLRQSPNGVALADQQSTGMVLPFTLDDTTAPLLAVLMQAPAATRGPLPIPLLLVIGLLLVFASLAGWIQLSGEPRSVNRLSVVLLSLVPALTAWGFLIHADRLFQVAVEEVDRRDLTRAMAMARVRGVASDPDAIHAMTGFHSYLVRNGSMAAASIEGGASAIAALPSPPPSFTSTGWVVSPEGRVSYVALRMPDGGIAVTTTRPSHNLLDPYRTRAQGLAALLAGWLLVLGAALTVRMKRVSS